mmetsp:Transcript_42559/g.68531  ORF Transcript_42559/g.68531 Transcript_42559/m.68531 type:complete len:250 (+) Transcript_42559:83-832(+)
MKILQVANALLAASTVTQNENGASCTTSKDCATRQICATDSKCLSFSSLKTCADLKLIPGLPEIQCFPTTNPSVTASCGNSTNATLAFYESCVGENVWCNGPSALANETSRFDTFFDKVINDCNTSGNIEVYFNMQPRITDISVNGREVTTSLKLLRLRGNITQLEQSTTTRNLERFKNLTRKRHLLFSTKVKVTSGSSPDGSTPPKSPTSPDGSTPTTPPTNSATRETYSVLLTSVVFFAFGFFSLKN